ncbi:hypothetical protein GRJ2_001163700 [Grus japonensis]|uniref:Uncharacterized protein n=1 Tax=Grus japonensis TaxID=30415 RepID=A0ABC9WQ87_GRUJA
MLGPAELYSLLDVAPCKGSALGRFPAPQRRHVPTFNIHGQRGLRYRNCFLMAAHKVQTEPKVFRRALLLFEHLKEVARISRVVQNFYWKVG